MNAKQLIVNGFWGRSKGVEEVDIYYFTEALVKQGIPYIVADAATVGKMSQRYMKFTLEFLTEAERDHAQSLLEAM